MHFALVRTFGTTEPPTQGGVSGFVVYAEKVAGACWTRTAEIIPRDLPKGEQLTVGRYCSGEPAIRADPDRHHP